MNFRPRRRGSVDVPLVSMIDVVFLLLIFFMVTTTFNRETELKIQLPEAKGTERQPEKQLELAIDAEGRYYVNKHEVINQSLETLKKAIREAAGSARDLPFIISADAKTPHQAVISALDAAGQLGFLHITFATAAPSGS